MKLSELNKGTLKTTVEFTDQADGLNIEFRHKAITPRLVARLNNYTESESEEFSGDLASLIVAWDLMAEDDTPMAIDKDLIASTIGIFDQVVIVKAMVKRAGEVATGKTN